VLDLTTAWDRPCRNKSTTIGSEKYLRVRLRPRLTGDGLAAHVALALDVSGSMNGKPLEEARKGCLAAATLLRPQDRLSVIAFSTGVQEVLKDQPMASVNLLELTRKLHALKAEGVTRTDQALGWLDQTLRPQQGPRFAILATDGFPTDHTGNVLANFDGLTSLAQRLGQAGISLSAIGLGDATDFNVALLNDFVNQGRGALMQADSDGELTRMLSEHFQQAQAVGAEYVDVTLTPEMPGLELRENCQIAPVFLPMDQPQPRDGSWRIRVNNVRGDVDTDLLFHLHLPAPNFAAKGGRQRALTVAVQAPDPVGQAQVEAFVENVCSLTEEQQLNKEVHEARLLWDMNNYQEAILHSTDLQATSELLQGLLKTAQQAGNAHVAETTTIQLDQLKASGKIDPNSSMRMSQSLRNQGGK